MDRIRCRVNAIQKYFQYKQSLIDQYVKGDMTKNEYLERNLDAVLSLGIKPFKNIDTVEKGLFNYQYYNAMAKDYQMRMAAYADNELQAEMRDESNFFYYKKDKSTLAVLNMLNYQNISAYFIKVRSKYLKGRLFEVVLYEYEMILHSKSGVILRNLRREGVFIEAVKPSLIDGYINQRY